MDIKNQVKNLIKKFEITEIEAYNIALKNNLMMFKSSHLQRENDYLQSKKQA